MATQIDGAVQREVGILFEGGTMVSLADGTLIERFASRQDEAAFAALVERHGPMVFRVCRAALRDEHEAHDAFQAAFLVLVRKARTLWVRESVGPWLHGVAWRIASRARASGARRRLHEQRAAEMAPRSLIKGGESSDVEALLHEEIHKLPDRFRAVVILCDLEGLGTDEAAQRLGTPVGTARSRLARGRARLRARLIRRGIGPVVVASLTTSFASAGMRPPVALVETTLRAAVEFARVGTVSAPLALMMNGAHQIMAIKAWTIIGTVVTAAIVAGAGAIVAQSPGKVGGGAKTDVKALGLPSAAAATDLERLQGRWTILNVKGNGKDLNDSNLVFSTLMFRGEEIDLEARGNKPERKSYRFKIDPGVEPKAMRVVLNHPNIETSSWWLYAFEKDKLRIALYDDLKPQGRPTGFETSSENSMMVLELVRDITPPQTVPQANADQAELADPITDLERLQGRWTVVKVIAPTGKVVDDPNVKAMSITFRGHEIDWEFRGESKPRLNLSFKIDPDGKPKAMRVLPSIPLIANSSWWIYDFGRDNLRIGMYEDPHMQERPTGFTTTPANLLTVFELVRETLPPQTAPQAKADQAKPADSATDLERLQGRWVAIAANGNRDLLAESDILSLKLTFRGQEVEMELPSQKRVRQTWRVKLDSGSKPKAIELTSTDPRFGKPKWLIYNFEPDRLNLGFYVDPEDQRRPTSFEIDPKWSVSLPSPFAGKDQPARLELKPKNTFVTLQLVHDPNPPTARVGTSAGTAKSLTEVTAKPIAPTQARPDFDTVLGKWKVLTVKQNGRENKETELTGATFTFDPKELEITDRGGKSAKHKYTILPESNPQAMQIDWLDHLNSQKKRLIYKLNGNKLKIAFDSKDRPALRLESFDQGDPEGPIVVVDLVRNSTTPETARTDPSPEKNDASTDKERFQGKWRAIRVVEKGREKLDSSMQNLVMTVLGDNLEMASLKGKFDWKLHQIDEKTTPRAIQVGKADSSKDRAWWIYAFVADTLRINVAPIGFGDQRPKSFDDYTNDTPFMVIDFVRDDPPKTSVPSDTTKKPADPAADELSRIQGAWAGSKVVDNGKVRDKSNSQLRLLIRGNRMVFVDSNRLDTLTEYRIEVDASSEPRALRMYLLDDTGKGSVTNPGVMTYSIYSLQGDVLKFATDPRHPDRKPRNFEDFGQDDRSLTVGEYIRQEPLTLESNGRIEPKKQRNESARADRERLIGKWVVRKAKINGQEAEYSKLALATFSFDRDTARTMIPGQADNQLIYRIDPEARPKAFRVASNQGADPGVWLYDFVEGENGGLKVAFDDSPQKPRRPKSFEDFDPARPLTVLELDRDETPASTKITMTETKLDPSPFATGNTKSNLTKAAGPVEVKTTPVTAAKPDRERLQGKWKILKAHENGVEENDTGFVLAPLTIGPEEIELDHQIEGKQRFTYRIDPDSSSRALIVVNQKTKKSDTWIYKIEGEKLKIAFDSADEPKPARSFDKPEPGQLLLVLDLVRDEAIPIVTKPKAKPGTATQDGDLARLKGTWKVLAREENGEELNDTGEESLIIAGNAMVTLWNVNGTTSTEVASFTIDPSHEPKTLDLIRTNEKGEETPSLAIYRVDGPTLTLCFDVNGKGRPTEFDTKPQSGHRLIVLRRKKPLLQPVATPVSPTPASPVK